MNICAKSIKGNKAKCSMRLGQHELITDGSPNVVDRQIHNGREKAWQMLTKRGESITSDFLILVFWMVARGGGGKPSANP